jgi:hypothetical protein
VVAGNQQLSELVNLLRPYLDENGAEWQASPYWAEVTDRLDGLQLLQLPVAELPEIEQAACQNEILTALAISGAEQVPAAITKSGRLLRRASHIMRIRNSWGPAGIYEGYLASEQILSQLRARFGTAHRWSPSRLNSYGNCPYGFFAQTVLGLEARDDPIDGLDAMQQGSLLHAILEELHAYAAQQAWQFSLEYQQLLIQQLEKFVSGFSSMLLKSLPSGQALYGSTSKRSCFACCARWLYGNARAMASRLVFDHISRKYDLALAALNCQPLIFAMGME